MVDTIGDAIKSYLEAQMKGFQEFTAIVAPATLAQAYTFKLTLNGVAFNSGNDISVTLAIGETLTTIATKLQTAINSITASSVTTELNTFTSKIRVYSTSVTTGSAVSFSAPTAGSSLITLLTSVDTAVNRPTQFNLDREYGLGTTKTLTGVIISESFPNNRPASVNQLAHIRESMFEIRCSCSTREIAKLMVAYIKSILLSRSMSGAWYNIPNDFIDKSQTDFSVGHLWCKETRFATGAEF